MAYLNQLKHKLWKNKDEYYKCFRMSTYMTAKIKKLKHTFGMKKLAILKTILLRALIYTQDVISLNRWLFV
jgi:hypothetical protein